MNRIPQVIYTNPAFIPDSRVNVGLPMLSSNYFSLGNSGFAFNSLLDVDNMIQKMAAKNYLTSNIRVDLLSVGIGVKENYFSLNVTEHVDAKITYPKGLFQFIWEGNGGELLGTRANMDGLGFDFMHHREYALGFARNFSEKLTVGSRLKYLSGFQNIWTKTSQLGLTTDSTTYDITLDGAMEVNTSGINGIVGGEFDVASGLINAGNNGVAIDIGGSYKYTDKIAFSSAILDLGFISWKNDVRNYKKDDFKFTFSGVDLGNFFSEDTSGGSSQQAIMDSLEAAFKVNESTDAYQTWLNAKVLLGATYKLTKNHTAGALIYTEFAKGNIRPALTLSMNTKVQRWLSASLSYSVYNRSFANVGLGLSLNAGPVQLYVVTDNILAPIVPQAVKNAHLRFGINMTFGRKKKEAAPAPSVN